MYKICATLFLLFTAASASATPPAWLVYKHPEIRTMEKEQAVIAAKGNKFKHKYAVHGISKPKKKSSRG